MSMRLLLVDDDEVDRRAVRRALSASRLGADCLEVADCAAARAAVHGEGADCLLLDYRLPDMDGLEFLRELRADRVGAHIPVVLLTGHGNLELAIKAMQNGAQDYLPKADMSPATLERTITTAIRLMLTERERRAAVDALRFSQADLARAQAIGKVGSWDWDVETNVVEWSDEAYRIFGAEPGAFPVTFDAFMRLVHPDDRERVEQTVRSALREFTPFAIAFRTRRRDGTEGWVQGQGAVLTGAAGRPQRMRGTVQDVTEHRLREAELQQYRQYLETLVSERTANLEAANAKLEAQIAGRKQAEAKLKTERNLLQSILDSVGDGVSVADGSGKLILINPAGRRMTGVGVTDIGPEEWADVYGVFEPDGQTAMAPDRMPLVRALRGESCTDVEMIVRNADVPDGVVLSCTATPLVEEEGAVVVYRDMTQRKLAEQELTRALAALADSEAQLTAILETAVDGIVTIDESGTMQSFNSAAARIFGYADAEVIGQNVTMLMPVAYREAHIEGLANYLRTGKAKIIGRKVELFGLRKDGNVVPIEVAVSEVRRDGRRLFTGVVRDITDRKRQERALQEAHETLEQRARELQAANEELSQYSYVVSHDLKAPLRAIHNYADFLLEDLGGTLAEEQESYLQGLGRAVQQSEALVDDLLALSRVGRRELQTGPIAVAPAVRQVLAVLDMPAGVEVSVDVPDVVVQADDTLFRQVFQNLITNGIKFNDKPRKWIQVGRSATASGQTCELFVRDNGIGIEPAYQEQIFKIFQRLHGGEEYEGTGIGLAIVKRAVERLGGAVRLESQPGEGSTFFVTLPLATPAEETDV